MEGDARGGAALSVKKVTGKPIKFVGVGESVEALEIFHPDRTASRILGMGDVLSLIERAEAVVDQKSAEKLARKIQKNAFTLEDFLEQIQQIKKMGSLEQIMDMIPGINKFRQLRGCAQARSERTGQDRSDHPVDDPQRASQPPHSQCRSKAAHAKGSGTSVAEVNRVLKSYTMMLKMMKSLKGKGVMAGGKRRKLPKGLNR